LIRWLGFYCGNTKNNGTFNKSGAMLFFFTVSNNRNFSIESERKSSNFEHNVKIIAMKSYFIIIASAVVLLSSCSVYRSGQTPDDVYYSPAREQRAVAAGYVPADGGREDGRRYNDRQTYQGYDDFATAEDRWLMMRVRNRSRWSVFDDYNYYSPYNHMGWGGFYPSIGMGYGLGYGMGFGMGYGGYNPYGFNYYNHFNNFWNWNSFYNPYFSNIIVVNPKTNPAGYTTLRNFNLNTYRNNNFSNRRTTTGNSNYNLRQRYNNSNDNNRTLGNSFRRVFSNSNAERNSQGNYSRPSQDRPVRTYQPSNNNSPSYTPRSSGGSSGSSNSGSRPSRR